MRRGTIFVIVFLLIAAGVVGVSFFLRSQPPLELTIAVSPLAVDWATASAAAFNATEPLANGRQPIRIRVTPLDDLDAWGQGRTIWNDSNRPDGWLAATSTSFAVLRATGEPLEVTVPVLAFTPLMWGGFAREADDLTDNGVRRLDWPLIAERIAAGDSDLRLAFPNPATTTTGFAVVVSGAAALNQTAILDIDDFGRDFRAWMTPMLQSVASYNTFGASVAETMAARGPSVGSVGLLPESEWLANLRGQLTRDGVRLAYPQFPLFFTFGYAVWGRQTPAANEADRAAGVQAFGMYLQSEAAQLALAEYGLRPPSGVAPNAGLFTAGVQYGVLLSIDPAEQVIIPQQISSLQTILGWVASTVD